MKTKTHIRPRTCIFCGRTGLSKEHIWSDWLKELIPRNPKHGEGLEEFVFDEETREIKTIRPLQYEVRQGCMAQRKVRKVCKTHCNNGWMGKAVEAAKPIASQIIQGNRYSLDECQMATLAFWLGITIVMQEFTHPVIMIPPEERKLLMNTDQLPQNWSIWIGYYGGLNWYPMGAMRTPTWITQETSKKVRAKNSRPNYRYLVSTFTLRRMLTHAFTATQVELVNEYRQFVRDRNWNLVQLWPIDSTTIFWPRFPIMDGELSLIVGEWNDRRGVGASVNFRRQHGV